MSNDYRDHTSSHVDSEATESARGDRSWQKTKSKNTQVAILDAALACFHDLGYANTSTENIAKRAGVSRGAMLHHFPTRNDLIDAAVRHLHELRIANFKEEESKVQTGPGRSKVGAGIDAYWQMLNSPLFVVLQELRMAARTDSDLAAALKPMLAEYADEQFEATKQIFPDLALSEAFIRTNYLTLYLLEGMASAKMIGGAPVPEQRMLSWLKRELKRSYQDVLNDQNDDRSG